VTPERWAAICALFDEALERDPDERAAFVRGQCDRPEDAEQLLALLDGHDEAQAEGFLDAPSWAVDAIDVTLPDFDDYERIRYLGHGGMGVVYRAFDRSLDRWVALKLPRGDWPGFRVEVTTMARLRHANIVRVYEPGEVDGRPYLSMDLIDGPTLASERERLAGDPRAVAALLAKVARAVDHAHRRGVLHRDLKPGNVLLDEDGEPHITDFGLARPVDAPPSDDPTGGTIGYMSPEQADPKRDETVQSDVYALGAMLLTLLPGSDADLAAVGRKATAEQPNARHGSAEDFAADLDRWLAGRPTSARRWSRSKRARAWAQRNPLVASLAAASAALFVLTMAFAAREIDELAQQPATTVRSLARHQADTLGLRMKQLAQAVTSATTDPSLASKLRSADMAALQRSVMALGEQRVELNGRSPFETWFVLTSSGELVARWPEPPSAEQRAASFAERDYFSGALNEPQRTHASRVYFGVSDSSYKLGISRALIDAEGVAGVLVASLTTSPRLGLPARQGDGTTTALIARVDPSRIAPDTPAGIDQLLLMHPAYQRGATPLAMQGWSLPAAGVDPGYRDPAASIDRSFGGRWLAGFAAVDGTGLVVVSQRRDAAPNPLWLWAPLALAGLLALALLWRLVGR
jgi:serine/threonine-protein kinase